MKDETYQILIAIIINIVVPLAGLIVFFMIKREMVSTKIIDPPLFEIFAIFFIYGGLLVLILTVIIGEWSGMASIGLFFLMIFAPILMGVICYKQFKKRDISGYHKVVYHLSWLYFLIAPITIYLLCNLPKI